MFQSKKNFVVQSYPCSESTCHFLNHYNPFISMDLMFKPLSKVAMEVLDTNKNGQLAFGT